MVFLHHVFIQTVFLSKMRGSRLDRALCCFLGGRLLRLHLSFQVSFLFLVSIATSLKLVFKKKTKILEQMAQKAFKGKRVLFLQGVGVHLWPKGHLGEAGGWGDS